MRFRSAYDGLRNDKYSKTFSLPSMTEQSHKDMCDVNTILAKYKKINSVDFLNQYQGVFSGEFGDFSEVVDYHTALNKISAAKAAFGSLPASLRSRFDNDPGVFHDFVVDTSNRDELVKLGLAEVVGSSVKKELEKPIE